MNTGFKESVTPFIGLPNIYSPLCNYVISQSVQVLNNTVFELHYKTFTSEEHHVTWHMPSLIIAVDGQ